MAKSHASYLILINRSIRSLNPFNKSYISPISIKKLITRKYGLQFLKISNYYFRKALQKMLGNDLLEKHGSKYMFRLKPKSVKKQEKTTTQSQKNKKKMVVLKKKITKNSKPLKAKPRKKEEKKKEEMKQNVSVTKMKSLEKKASFKPKQAIWQFYDKHNPEVRAQNADGWYNYDVKASDVVEEEWQKYIKNRMMCDVRAVKSGHFEYSVDFMSWNQTNITHHAHKVRKIRRLDENGNVSLNPYK